ncbi:hypothetical protein RHIZO_02451 [Rhizobiaceae bacterium]|nr:hypothetical protein RHIZO_02451 [Rhizobiaceae bacterium]
MAAILSFVPRNAARKSTKSTAEGAGAIIIFPGVRYERPAKAGDAALPAKPSSAIAGEKGPSKH